MYLILLKSWAKTQSGRRRARMLSSPVTLHGSIELFPHQHGAGKDVSDEVTAGDRRPRSAEQSAPDHFLTVGDGRGSRRPRAHDFLWRRRRRDRARPRAARGLPLGQDSPARARGGRLFLANAAADRGFAAAAGAAAGLPSGRLLRNEGSEQQSPPPSPAEEDGRTTPCRKPVR